MKEIITLSISRAKRPVMCCRLLVLEEDSSKLSRTVGLHGFLTSKVREMETTMQEKAISDFNNWLVKPPSPPPFPQAETQTKCLHVVENYHL